MRKADELIMLLTPIEQKELKAVADFMQGAVEEEIGLREVWYWLIKFSKGKNLTKRFIPVAVIGAMVGLRGYQLDTEEMEDSIPEQLDGGRAYRVRSVKIQP